MSDIKIDSLKIEAKTNIKDAISDIEALKQALSGLGDGTSGINEYQYAVSSLVQRLTKLNGIASKAGQDAVKRAVEDVAKAYMNLDAKAHNVASTQEEVNRAFDNVQEKISEVSQVIASNVREIREISEESKKLVDYTNGISGKIKIDPISIKSSFDPKDFAAMRSVLGKKFTSTGNGYEFESFINDMNQAIGTTFDTSKGLDIVFEELVSRLREIHNESRKLSTSEMFQRGLIPEKEIETEVTHFASNLDNLKNKFNFSEAQLFGGESNQLLTFRDQLKSVTSAVNEKNKAFEKEQNIVSKASLSEIKDLINLKDKVDSLVQSVAGTNGLTAALSNLKNFGLSELASLKDIDFSGIAKVARMDIKRSPQLTVRQSDTVKEIDFEKAAEEYLKGFPGLISWQEKYIKDLQEAEEDAKQFLGNFYIPKELEELQIEFRSVNSEILQLKKALRDARESGKSGSIFELQESLAKALAYASELSESGKKINANLRLPKKWTTTAGLLAEKTLNGNQVPKGTESQDNAVEKEIISWKQAYNDLFKLAEEGTKNFLGSFHVPDATKELQSELSEIQKRISEMKTELRDVISKAEGSINPRDLLESLSSAMAYEQELSKALQNNDNAAKTVIRTEQEYTDALSNAAQEGRIFKDVVEQEITSIQKVPYSFSEFKSSLKEMIGVAGEFIGKSQSLAKSISKIGSKIASAEKKVASFAKSFVKLSWSFLNFNSVQGLKNPFRSPSEGLGDFNSKLKYGIQTVARYGFGIRSLYVLFNKLRSGIQDGFNNLVLYSDKANKSISLLSSDMSYLGNSVAGAFEPILNIVAPIIDQIVDYMIAGINSVGAFIAAITGQSSYTVAVKNIKDYRDSLNGAASAGDSAGDAVDDLKDKTKDLKKEIMGFDEIEKFTEDLNDAANNGSGSGGGSGSGNSKTEDPILFTKKDIPGAVSNFADLVKDAWEKSDFTEIGNIVGTKLKNALDSIDWEPIKESANKIAKVTATFINGFFETTGLDESVGRTLGEAVNTGIGAINTFVDTTHWKSIGEFVSGGLRSSIDAIDWDGLGKTLNAKYKALWGFLDGFVVDMSTISFIGTTGWQEAGNALATTINSIFADRDYSSAGTTIASGINGIASALDTSVNKIDFKKISTNFANGVNSIFTGVDFKALGVLVSNGLNTASESLNNFSVKVNWEKIGKNLANNANTILANTDFSAAGKALGSAFKGALSSINEFAATFNWRSLGVDINNFIKGINWKGVLKTSASIVANTFFGLFEAAWGAVFGGSDTKYTAIADNLNKAISKLNVEWPELEEDELKKFDNVSAIVDKFLELNEKLKKNGSLSEIDMSLFKTYYDQIVEYAPEAADLIGKVGKAYQGTDEALKSLIERQKNMAISKGFEEAMQTAAKTYADATLALDGAVTELVTSIANNQKLVYDAWTHDKPGTWDQFEKDLESLFKKMRDGSLDVDHLTESEGRMLTALQMTNSDILTQTSNVLSLIDTKDKAADTLDQIGAASERYSGKVETATISTEKLVKKLSGIKLTGVWKSLEDELKNTLDSVTDSLKDDKFTLGISNTLTDMFDKEFKVKLKVGGLDTSKLTDQDKTIQGASANIISAKNTLPDYMKALDFTAVLTQKRDSIQDRIIDNLQGIISQVSEKGWLTLSNVGAWISAIAPEKGWLTLSNVGAWISAIAPEKGWLTLSNVGAWISAIASQKNGMTLSNIGAWISYIGSQVGGMSLNNIGAWISAIAPQTGLTLTGILGYINQVAKQSGVSLILEGIHGVISSISNIFSKKETGGAYYAGGWHSIAQFSNGGVITPSKMLNFNAVPKFAGGTLDAGSMFIAGEAGPELVGHVGGRTEVLNQSQLASVMETSVRSAMETVMSRYMSYGNGTVNVNVVLRGDAEKIFEVVKAENNSRVMQTGRAQLLT